MENNVIEVVAKKGLFNKDNIIIGLAGVGAVTLLVGAVKLVRYTANKMSKPETVVVVATAPDTAPAEAPVTPAA